MSSEKPVKPSRSGGGRLAFLDFTRGIGAVIMLQGHVFHAFTATEHRNAAPYIISQFVGGMPPAIFLFLLGVTLAFGMDGREKRGAGPWQRVRSAFGRAGFLLLAAIAFRLQLWVFGLPKSPWTDLLKVDILNSMALAVAVFSIMGVFTTVDRVRLCGGLGIAIAAASPLVSQLDWTGVPSLVKAYIAPDYNHFAFFPWAAFVAFGMSAGSIIRLLDKDHLDRAMQWTAIVAFGMIFGSQYFANLPYSVYSKSEFWLDGPWLIFMKTGIILLMFAAAHLWTRHLAGDKWSWVRQFGMTSLLVYWVHIELVYGRWFWFWKERLTVPQTIVAAVALILLMLGLSVVKTNWNNLRPRLGAFAPEWYYNVFRMRRAD